MRNSTFGGVTNLFLQILQGDIQKSRGDNISHPVKISNEELSPPKFRRNINDQMQNKRNHFSVTGKWLRLFRYGAAEGALRAKARIEGAPTELGQEANLVTLYSSANCEKKRNARRVRAIAVRFHPILLIPKMRRFLYTCRPLCYESKLL